MKRKRYGVERQHQMLALPTWIVFDSTTDYVMATYESKHPSPRAAALAEAKRLNKRERKPTP